MPDDGDHATVEELLVEFFLAPANDGDLWRETAKLVAGCIVFIAVLAFVTALTRGTVVRA